MAFEIIDECIGCGVCAKNCPVMAIEGKKNEKHSINEKRCVSCGVCQNGCPKEAILDDEGRSKPRIPKEKWKKPRIQKKACSACSLCVNICIFEAIQITYPRFMGDLKVYAKLVAPEKCVGCGLCEKVCSLRVIKMEVFND